MKNYLSSLLVFILLVSSSFAGDHSLAKIDGDILLSLERIKLQNEILHKQYEDLKDIESSIDPIHNDAIIDSLAQKIITDIESSSNYKKNTAWGEVKDIVHHIKEEAKILSRKNGLAISIIIMTIELTELPMKALAVSIGSPILVVLYEVLQPGILIPAIIIGIKNIAKTAKTKKLFQNKDLYRQWKNSERKVLKELKIKKGNNEISYLVEDNNYIVDSSNIFNDTLNAVGFYRGRLDYKNLKRFIKRNNINTTRLNFLKEANIHKQIKAKFILDELVKLGFSEKIQNRFVKARTDLKSQTLNAELTKWVYELLNSKSDEQTQYLFQNLPRSESPLIFFELWESKIMEEFFATNNQYKNKYYRKLQTKLLPIIVRLRKDALINNFSPAWTPELEQMTNSYFRPLLD